MKVVTALQLVAEYILRTRRKSSADLTRCKRKIQSTTCRRLSKAIALTAISSFFVTNLSQVDATEITTEPVVSYSVPYPNVQQIHSFTSLEELIETINLYNQLSFNRCFNADSKPANCGITVIVDHSPSGDIITNGISWIFLLHQVRYVYSRNSDGQVSVSGPIPTDDWTASSGWICPKNFERQQTGPGDNMLLSCVYTEKKSCSVEGNPIKVGTGEKIEYAVDFSTADGLLTLERRYVNQWSGWKIDEPPQLTDVAPGSTKPMARFFSNSMLSEYSMVIPMTRMYPTPELPFNIERRDRVVPLTYSNPSNHRVVYLTLKGLLHRFDEQSGQFVLSGNPSSKLRLSRLETSNSNEARWRLTRGSGDLVFFAANGQPLRTEYATGGTIFYEYDNGRLASKTDHLGRSLVYIHDDSGRLTSVSLPDGSNVEYSYDDSEDQLSFYLLKEVRWSNGERIGYAYNESEHLTRADAMKALTGKFDAYGERIGTYKYLDRRAVLSEGALGSNKRTFTFSGVRVRVADSLGSDWFYEFANQRNGNNLSHILTRQPAGSGCAASSNALTYYADGLKRTDTDFNGNKSLFAYDHTRALETTRVEGVAKADYNDYLFEGSILPAGATKTSTQWHPQWQKPVRVASANLLTTNIYNGDSDPFNGGITAQCAPIDRPLLCRKVQQATLDPDGALGFAAELDIAQSNREWLYTYNDRAQLLTSARSASAPPDITLEYYEDTTSYWTKGDLKTRTDALGNQIRYESYDPNGRALSQVDANGVETTFTYDVRGRLVSQSTAGSSVVHTYDLNGNLIHSELPNGSTVTYDYDAAQRLIAIENSAGDRISYILDTEGNRLSETIEDSNGTITYTKTYVYDALSRLEKDANSQEYGTTYLYDPNGNLTGEVDALQRSTQHQFSREDHLTRTTDAAGGVANYTYDGQGKVTQVVDQNGNATTYEYNAFGELIRQVSPDTGTTTYTYNNAGNRISSTDARGITAEYSYDALSRLTDVRYPDFPDENVTYEYDRVSDFGIGRLTGVRTQSFHTYFLYNALGQVVQKVVDLQGQRYTTRYNYHADTGLLYNIVYPSDRRLTYATDSEGRIANINTQTSQGSDHQTLADQIQYLPFGPAKSYRYGSGLKTTHEYDLDYRLNRIDVQNTNALLSRNYFYDVTNNVIGIQDNVSNAKSQSFEYDLVDRLTGAEGVYGRLGYLYDDVGNRLSETRDQVTDAYDYSPDSNRLTLVQQAEGTRDFEYDAAGNMTRAVTATGDVHTYTYNAAGRLSSVAINGEAAAQYRYNPFGQRVSKMLASGTTELYHYDEQGQLLAVTDATGNTQREYLYWGSQQVALVVHAGTGAPVLYYIHSDHLNTPQALTDENQQVVWMADYEPFGKIAEQDQDSVMHLSRFPGQYEDKETGLYYNYFRDYDPSLGRYVQSDPIGLEGGINTYAYVHANPLRYIDTNGLIAKEISGGLGGLVYGSGIGAAPGNGTDPSTGRCFNCGSSESLSRVDRSGLELPGRLDRLEERAYDKYCADSEDPCTELKAATNKAIFYARIKMNNMLTDPNNLFGTSGWITHANDLQGRINNIRAMISLGIRMGCDMTSEASDAATLYVPSAPI